MQTSRVPPACLYWGHQMYVILPIKDHSRSDKHAALLNKSQGMQLQLLQRLLASLNASEAEIKSDIGILYLRHI